MSELGMVELDSPFAKEVGFTSDKFEGYLWLHPDCVYISFIVSTSEGQGNLSKLFDAIWERGYKIKVPTPFARMEAILEKKGFEHTWEPASWGGPEEVEVWVK